MSLAQLGDIEVTTASKVPVKINRTPAAIFVITQEDIRRSGATSLPEALRLAPGVNVARIDGAKWSVGIRGFGSRLSRGVLVVIDGRNVYSPLHAGVFWEAQDTLIEDVDRIEIIRGPGATIWGPNAVNGVINIITKKSKDTHGTLLSTGGGNDQRFLNFRYGSGNGNFNYRVYAKVFDRGPEFHRDRHNFDEWQTGQSGFRMDWDLKNADTLTLQGDIYKGSIGESIAVAYDPTIPPSIVQTPGEHAGGNLLARWTHSLKDGSDLRLQVYYDHTRKLQANFTETRDTIDFDLLHHKRLAKRHEFLYGAGVRFSAGRTPLVVDTFTFNPASRTDKLYSAFVQDEIRLLGEGTKGLWLTLGSKLLRTDFSGFGVQPTARLLWTSGQQTWWASVTRALRTPSDLEETYTSDGFASAKPVIIIRNMSDGRFVPETVLGYETGYRRVLGSKLAVDFAAFHNRYDNLASKELGVPFVQSSPLPSRIVVPFIAGNGIYGATSGFEIAPDWKPVPWWRFNASYSYLHMDLDKKSESRDAVGAAKSTVGLSPHHVATLQSSMDLPGRLEFSQSYRFVSDLPTQLVPSYGTAGIRLSWRASSNFEFSVVGENLLQPQHAEYGGNQGTLVGIKRSIYGAITWRQ